MQMEPVTKTDRLLGLLRAGDHRGALKLAKTFRLGMTSGQRADITRAHECYSAPHFYAQLGKDPLMLQARGVEVLLELYGSRL